MHVLRTAVLTFALIAAPAAARAGEVVVVGSGDGLDVLRSVAAAFTRERPDITIKLPPSIGSGGAIAAVGGDAAVLGRLARQLSDADKAIGLKATPIFRVPTAIYAHPSARIAGLTSTQLAAIFSGAVTNWSEVGGPNLRIRVIAREEGESALTILRATMPGWKDLVFTPRSKIESSTPEVIETTLATEGAISFASYSRAASDRGALVLSVDGRAPMDPGYPAIQTLSLVYKEAMLTPDARAFHNFILTEKSRVVIVGTTAALPTD